MRVLIPVDVLNDFCPGGALPVPEGDQIVPVVNRLMSEGGYDAVIAVQEWHSADNVSFAVNHPGKQVLDTISVDGLVQVLWPVHGVQHTWGAEFHPALETSRFDAVVRKGQDPAIDSYSGFADNGKRRYTELGSLIDAAARAVGARPEDVEIDVVGLALDYCVKATALDAAERGHRVSVIIDATRAVDPRPEPVMAVLRELQSRGIAVIESRERLPERAAGREVDCARDAERGMSV